MWELDHKEDWVPNNWYFWTVILEKILERLLDHKIKPVSPKGNQLNIHWKDWCWSWSSNPLATCCEELIHWKRPWCWEKLRAAEDEMVGWHCWLNEHEFEKSPRDSEGQGSLVSCSPWGEKELELDMTEQMNNKQYFQINLRKHAWDLTCWKLKNPNERNWQTWIYEILKNIQFIS